MSILEGTTTTTAATGGLPLSDLEASQQVETAHENAAQQILDRVGDMLDAADAQLERLEDEQDSNALLSNAIYRTAQDLAEAVGNLAHHLEHQTEEEQRQLAEACLRDVQQHSLYLQEEQSLSLSNYNNDNDFQQQQSSSSSPSPLPLQDTTAIHQELAHMNAHDFGQIIQAASVFLRDVEASLRALERAEAEEVADVALTVARLFIASLQSLHEQCVPQDLVDAMATTTTTTSSHNATARSSVTIEVLDENDDNVHDEQTTNNKNTTKGKSAHKQSRKRRMDRLRVLWPPLGPQVQKACQWGQQAATDQPLLAIALGFTLWPAAILSAMIGAPFLIADKVLQDVYNHFQQGPLLQSMERGAAQLYQTGRLALVSGKLVTRQTWRIAQRQVNRHGGLPQIAQNVLAFGVDRVTHPVETAGMVWDGLCWTKDRVCETVERFRDPERDASVEELL